MLAWISLGRNLFLALGCVLILCGARKADRDRIIPAKEKIKSF